MARSWFRRMFPPYYKYAVFLLAGFELVFACLVLAISEAYYKSAALLLPISYKMFDDTVKKRAPGFQWDDEARNILEMYKYKMMVVWVICTFCVLFCMIVVIPQFFDFNDRKGNPSHLCLVKQKIGWILFWMQGTIAVVLGLALIWAWIGCGHAVALFHRLFDACYKEEIFLSELEVRLECTTDDDKEIADAKLCWQNVRTSFIPTWWMHAIVIGYFVGHIVLFFLVPVVNRQLIKDDDDQDTSKELLEA